MFIITKEYFNYSGCSRQLELDEEIDAKAPMVPTIVEPVLNKPEEQEENFRLEVIDTTPHYNEEEMEPRLNIFEEKQEDDGLFSAPFEFCDGDNAFPSEPNEAVLGDEYEQYGFPFLAKVPYDN